MASQARACVDNPFLRPNPTLAAVAAARSSARDLARKGYGRTAVARKSGLPADDLQALFANDAAPDSRVVLLRLQPVMIQWAIGLLLDAGHRVRLGRTGILLVDGRRRDPEWVLARGAGLVAARPGGRHA